MLLLEVVATWGNLAALLMIFGKNHEKIWAYISFHNELLELKTASKK